MENENRRNMPFSRYLRVSVHPNMPVGHTSHEHSVHLTPNLFGQYVLKGGRPSWCVASVVKSTPGPSPTSNPTGNVKLAGGGPS
jgi:hypothetical protein